MNKNLLPYFTQTIFALTEDILMIAFSAIIRLTVTNLSCNYNTLQHR
jgi:hypothetical protein